MQNESLTLFIPLLGKARMSREGLFPDEMAEHIVSTVAHDFSRLDSTRKLAVYMAMRARQFDRAAEQFAREHPDGVILHLGCGLDSRCLRVACTLPWYDLDFPDVMALRRTFYQEDDRYHMIAAPALPATWLKEIPAHPHALVLAEGLTMYLSEHDMRSLMDALLQKFPSSTFMFDAYSPLAAKLSALKNPINAVKAKIDFAMKDPAIFASPNITPLPVQDIVTEDLIEILPKRDRSRFRFLGKASKGLYRIFSYCLSKM